ncbi:MAG: hypothetical protein JSS97_02250 [Actinobacteria bacterium]|nr:hypothetical protein [Actinomycetota bacterium]
MIEKVRRVVIGAEPGQASTFTHVEEVDPVDSPGGALKQWPAWGWERVPTVPSADAPGYAPPAPAPPPGGVRVITLRGAGDTAEAMGEVGDSLPGFRHDDSRPGMHSTDTVDVAVVIEGEPVIEAEDGARQTLRPGDVYVCNGAMHRWHYDPENPATLVFFAFGAEGR